MIKETLIKSLSDFILGFLYRVRNHLTRIASYLMRMMTKLCIKIHMKFDSAIESAFPKVHIGKEMLIAASDDGVRVS